MLIASEGVKRPPFIDYCTWGLVSIYLWEERGWDIEIGAETPPGQSCSKVVALVSTETCQVVLWDKYQGFYGDLEPLSTATGIHVRDLWLHQEWDNSMQRLQRYWAFIGWKDRSECESNTSCCAWFPGWPSTAPHSYDPYQGFHQQWGPNVQWLPSYETSTLGSLRLDLRLKCQMTLDPARSPGTSEFELIKCRGFVNTWGSMWVENIKNP